MKKPVLHLMVLSPVIWLLFSAAFYDYLATPDEDGDAVVPAMSAAFLTLVALWAAYFLFINPYT
jgi:hypothetical protein